MKNLQYKMFLLNPNTSLNTYKCPLFTIQNVPIKSKTYECFSYTSERFTIQNVPLKFSEFG